MSATDSTQPRTVQSITKEIIDNPFMPILFISEAIKGAVAYFFEVEPVVSYTILAVVFTFLWIFSDSIVIEWDKVIGE